MLLNGRLRFYCEILFVHLSCVWLLYAHTSYNTQRFTILHKNATQRHSMRVKIKMNDQLILIITILLSHRDHSCASILIYICTSIYTFGIDITLTVHTEHDSGARNYLRTPPPYIALRSISIDMVCINDKNDDELFQLKS